MMSLSKYIESEIFKLKKMNVKKVAEESGIPYQRLWCVVVEQSPIHFDVITKLELAGHIKTPDSLNKLLDRKEKTKITKLERKVFALKRVLAEAKEEFHPGLNSRIISLIDEALK